MIFGDGIFVKMYTSSVAVALCLRSYRSSSLVWFYISCSFDKSEFGKYLYGYMLIDRVLYPWRPGIVSMVTGFCL